MLVSVACRYKELHARICEAYRAEDVVVRYQNNEGDLVTIGTDEVTLSHLAHTQRKKASLFYSFKELAGAIAVAIVRSSKSIKLFVEAPPSIGDKGSSKSFAGQSPEVNKPLQQTPPTCISFLIFCSDRKSLSARHWYVGTRFFFFWHHSHSTFHVHHWFSISARFFHGALWAAE